MATTRWKTDREGNVIVFPLVDWTTAPAFEMSGLVQFRYVIDDEQRSAALRGEAEPEVLQLAIGALGCRQLGQSLLDLAESLEKPPQGELPS